MLTQLGVGTRTKTQQRVRLSFCASIMNTRHHPGGDPGVFLSNASDVTRRYLHRLEQSTEGIFIAPHTSKTRILNSKISVVMGATMKRGIASGSAPMRR